MTQEELEAIPPIQLLELLERHLTVMRAEIAPLPNEVSIIIESVCKSFDVTESQLMSESQVRAVAHARFAALTCIHAAHYSLQATAAFFRMHHTSVSFARKRVRELRNTDRVFCNHFKATLATIHEKDRHLELILPPQV